MASQIQIRRDTAANWTSVNPTLAQGEIGLETDTGKLKIGTGLAGWTSLSYFVGNIAGTTLDAIGDVTITSVQNGDFLRYNGSASVWINDPVNLSTDTVGDYVQSLIAGTGLTINNNSGEGSTPTLNIGQDVATSASVLFARVETTGDAVIGGNLTVNGTTTTLNTEHMTVEDQFITLNSGATGSPTLSAGIEVERGDLTNVFLHWNESTDKWETTNDGSTYSVIATNGNIALGTDTTGNYVSGVSASTGVTVNHTPGEGSTATISIGQDVSQSASVTFAKVTADLTGNVTGNVTGDLTGNADTATTLETARTISLSGDVSGSVSFDGSQNVGITATIQPNSVALGTDTSGDYVSSLVAGTGVSLTNNSGEGATPAVAIGQDVATSASVQFAAVTAPVVGNASTASALQTARTISLSGDVSGSVSFDGAADASITATIQPNSVALGTDTTGNYLADVTASTGVTISHTAGEGSTATFSIGQPVGTTDNVTFESVTVGNTGIYFEGEYDNDYETLVNAVNPTSDNQIQFPNASGTVALNGSIALGTDTTGNYMSNVSAGAGISVSHTPAEGSTATVSLDAELKDISDVSYSNGVQVTYNIGDTGPAGGVIFITPSTSGNSTGQYFEVAPAAAEVSSLTWAVSAYQSTTVSGADGTAIGTGQQNTADIVAQGNSNPAESGIAYANSYSYGGYSDWFIPSKDELAEFVTNKTAIEPLRDWTSTAYLYSSTEFNSQNAWIQSLQDGDEAQSGWYKNYPFFSFRPVRSFTAPTDPNTGDFLKWNGTGWVNDDIDLGADTTGIYVADIIAGTGVTITNGSSESASPTIAIGQAVGTSASVTFAHVTAPVTGNVTGNVTGSSGSTTGNAATATALQNARTISLTGDVSGSVSFDGTSNVSISSTIQPNSVALGTDTTGNYVNDITAGTGVTVTHTPGEGSSPTVAIGQDVATSASVTFAQLETTGSLIVGQNIYVSGSVVTENQVSLEIDDPFIYLNTTASAAGIDTGVVASYYDGSHKHSGYFRDATDGKFKFFDSYTPEPSNPIDTGDASYSPAPVVAEYFESTIATGTAPLTVSSTTVVTNLNADKLDGQDGSYYAPINNPTFTGTVSLPNNTVALGTQTTGNYVSDVTGGTGVTVTHTPGEGSSPSIAIGQSVATSASVTFAAVTAPLIGNVTGDVSGNAGTVTNGVYTTSSINALADVDTVSASPSSGQFLKWNGTNWVPDSVPTINALDDIGNVIAPSPSDGQFLKYVSASTAWVPANVPTINALDDIGDVIASSPGDGDFLRYVSGSAGWVSHTLYLDDIGGVDAPSPNAGDFLKWNGSKWVSDAIPTINALDDIGDVSASAPSNGQFLKYSSSANAWIPDSVPSINTLDDVGDVTITSAAVGQTITWDGSAWVNSSVIRDNLVRFYMEVM